MIEEKPKTARIPKGIIAPINDTREPIDIAVKTIGGLSYRMLVGAVGPLSGDTNKNYPGLRMTHLRLIIRMIAMRGFDAPTLKFSMNDILSDCSPAGRKRMRQCLDELARTWIHIIWADGRPVTVEQLLRFKTKVYYREGVDASDPAQISKESNILRREFEGVTFSEYFWRAFLNVEDTWNVSLNALNGTESDLVAAIYLILARRGYHDSITENTKGLASAVTMLTKLGVKVPQYDSQLRQIFERDYGRGSVLAQLNGMETSQHCLRVQPSLAPASAGYRFNVTFWIEGKGELMKSVERDAVPRGVFKNIWLKLGLPYEEFDRAQNNAWRKLTAFEEDFIINLFDPSFEVGSLDHAHRSRGMERLGENRNFYQLAKSFIGPRAFESVLGEAKLARTEGRITNTPAAWLGGALKKAFTDWATRRADKLKTAVA